MWRSLFGGGGNPSGSAAPVSEAAISAGAAAGLSDLGASFLQPHAALFKDCDACLRDAQPVTPLCERGHQLCFCCSLQTFAAALSDASTDASGGVFCPMCRAEGIKAWTPTASYTSHDAPPEPLAGWITPSCVQRLQAWGATASAAERTIAPGAPPVASLTPSQLRQYTLRVAERAIAHRSWLQQGATGQCDSASQAPAAAAGAGAAGSTEALGAPRQAAEAEASPALIAGWLAPPPPPACVRTPWERCGVTERLVACPSPACGASFVLRRADEPPSPAPSAAAAGSAAAGSDAAGSAAARERGGDATAAAAFCSVCPHCSTQVCADCGQSWTASLTLLQPPAATAPAASTAAATPRAGLLSSLLSLGGSSSASSSDAASAAETLTVCHAGLACGPYSELVDRLREAGGRLLSAEEKAALRALASRAGAGAPRPGYGADGSSSAGGAAADASRQAEEAAFAQQVLHMAKAGIKYCPQCGCPGTHPRGHACHHISPGTGCPNCGTHYCFVCLGAFAGRMQFACMRGCPAFCSDLCDCIPCSECRPGRGGNCTGCAGSSSCPSCSGHTSAGDLARAAERHASALAAAKAGRSWRGPRSTPEGGFPFRTEGERLAAMRRHASSSSALSTQQAAVRRGEVDVGAGAGANAGRAHAADRGCSSR